MRRVMGVNRKDGINKYGYQKTARNPIDFDIYRRKTELVDGTHGRHLERMGESRSVKRIWEERIETNKKS